MSDIHPQNVVNFTAGYVDGEIKFGPYRQEDVPPAYGELRWYGRDGQYTSLTVSTGQLYAFGSNGTFLPLRNLNTSATLTSCFRSWSDFTVPQGINFAACTKSDYMFYESQRFVIPEQEVLFPKLTSASYMFAYAQSSVIPKFSTAKLQTATYMFQNAKNLEVKGIDFQYVANASYMFSGSNNVRLPAGTVLKPSTADHCFNGSTFAFPKDMVFEPTGSAQWMFPNSTRITQWPDNITLSKATNLFTLFYNNTANLIAGVPDTLTCESATNCEHMFAECRPYDQATSKYQRLQRLPSALNLQKANSLSQFAAGCALDLDSLQRLAQMLPTYTSGTHNCTLGINKEIQTDPDVATAIAAIRAKGWTVSVAYNTLL